MASAKYGIKYPHQHIKGVKVITASTTLTKEDSDKLIVIDTTTAVVVTLPPTRNDLVFHITLKQLPGSGGHEIAPQAADQIRASFDSSTAAADDKSLFFGTDNAGTGDKVGDFITLYGDGSVGYYGVGQGSFFREA